MKPYCHKCRGRHWRFSHCAAVPKNPGPKTTEPPTDENANPPLHNDKADEKPAKKNYVGFPRHGDKFGFESNLGFGKTKTKFRGEET